MSEKVSPSEPTHLSVNPPVHVMSVVLLVIFIFPPPTALPVLVLESPELQHLMNLVAAPVKITTTMLMLQPALHVTILAKNALVQPQSPVRHVVLPILGH